MFTVKYRTFMIPPENDDDDVICEILPEEIRRGDGASLSMGQYDINVKSPFEAVINGVNNKRYGPVKYIATAIDQECGYVSGSTVHIYTTKYAADMLNIVHIHINDMSDFVTVEVCTMGDGEPLSHYNEFNNDASGKPLRYKVLVRDMKINHVLYNQGNDNIVEVPFNEVRVSVEEVLVHEYNERPGFTFVKVEHLPVCMMAC
jgi:hypothetical protein